MKCEERCCSKLSYISFALQNSLQRELSAAPQSPYAFLLQIRDLNNNSRCNILWFHTKCKLKEVANVF